MLEFFDIVGFFVLILKIVVVLIVLVPLFALFIKKYRQTAIQIISNHKFLYSSSVIFLSTALITYFVAKIEPHCGFACLPFYLQVFFGFSFLVLASAVLWELGRLVCTFCRR